MCDPMHVADAGIGDAERLEFEVLQPDALTRKHQESDVLVPPFVVEGFGLVMVEAMGTWPPVVTTTVPPMPEVVGVSPRSLTNPGILAFGHRWEKRFMPEDGPSSPEPARFRLPATVPMFPVVRVARVRA